jgi:hypothetical protein
MRYPLTAVITLLFISLGWVTSASAYDYPLTNPYEATVVGTPPADMYQWPDRRKVKTKTLKLNFGEDLTDIPLAGVFGIADLKLLFAKQKGPAPLIFVIAGTGANYNSPKVLFLMDTFYQAGYHVITIASPTKPPFMAAASDIRLPGLTNYDAEDLYKVMTKALDTVGKDIEITKKYVTGYSLGGIDSAFVGYLDSQRKEINFDKVLMINPPVNLYTSVSNLDNIIPEYKKKYPGATGEKIFPMSLTGWQNTSSIVVAGSSSGRKHSMISRKAPMRCQATSSRYSLASPSCFHQPTWPSHQMP